MKSLYIRLSPEVLQRLIELARQQRRRPTDQAALIVERALTGGEPCTK